MDSDSSRVDRDGIHIDRDLADEISIEDQLYSSVFGEFRFPSPDRRRLAGWVFVVFGLVALISIHGGWPVAVGFGVLAIWQFLSSWPLAVDENEAMTSAAAALDFPVGHASAAVRFHGWRSRPRWSVILYSAVEPPDQRALVVVDAVNGEIVEPPYLDPVPPI